MQEWRPCHKKDIDKMERIQKATTPSSKVRHLMNMFKNKIDKYVTKAGHIKMITCWNLDKPVASLSTCNLELVVWDGSVVWLCLVVANEHVCMHACMRVCIHACVHASVYIHMSACSHCLQTHPELYIIT